MYSRDCCGKVVQDHANLCALLRQAHWSGGGAPATGTVRGPNAKSAGVCAGMAEISIIRRYAGARAVLVITIFSAVVFGIVAYIVAWIVMPEEPQLLPAPQGQQVTNT